MKANQVEVIFVGVIILGFSIWKISDMIKSRSYEKHMRMCLADLCRIALLLSNQRLVLIPVNEPLNFDAIYQR